MCYDVNLLTTVKITTSNIYHFVPLCTSLFDIKELYTCFLFLNTRLSIRKMKTFKKGKITARNKATWRKYIDNKDVEDFLSEQRQDERIGDVSQKADEELFTFDSGKKEEQTSCIQKRKINALKPSRVVLSLQNTSKIECPLTQINRVKPRKDKTDLKKKKTSESKEKEFAVFKDVKRRLKKKSSYPIHKISLKDIWIESPNITDEAKEYQSEWMSKELTLHHRSGTGKPIVKINPPERIAKIRSELPYPGMSYNPSLEDHQNLIDIIINKETKIIKQKKHLDRVTTEMFSKVSHDELEESRKIQCDDEAEPEQLKEKDNQTADNERSVSRVVNKKKKKKSKVKQENQKRILKEKLLKLEKKKQVTDLHRLKSIVQDVAVEEIKANEQKKRQKQKKIEKKFEPKRTSKIKYQEPDIVATMPEDIPGNLRNLKTETKLIVDEFKNFQKKNILPVSIDVGTRKRRKIKRFLRKSHK